MGDFEKKFLQAVTCTKKFMITSNSINYKAVNEDPAWLNNDLTGELISQTWNVKY